MRSHLRGMKEQQACQGWACMPRPGKADKWVTGLSSVWSDGTCSINYISHCEPSYTRVFIQPCAVSPFYACCPGILDFVPSKWPDLDDRLCTCPNCWGILHLLVKSSLFTTQ